MKKKTLSLLLAIVMTAGFPTTTIATGYDAESLSDFHYSIEVEMNGDANEDLYALTGDGNPAISYSGISDKAIEHNSNVTAASKKALMEYDNEQITNAKSFSLSCPQSEDIGIGDYLQMGEYYGQPILWRCVGFEKISGYDGNGNPVMDSTDTRTTYEEGYLPLMLADKILCLKPFDAKGTDTGGSHGRGYYYNSIQGYHRQNYGSNYWGDSNIRDWLNSSASAGNVVWSCGNPPTSANVHKGKNGYAEEAGFLNSFSELELNAITMVTQKSILDGFEYADSSNTINPNYHAYNEENSESINTVVKNYSTAYSEQITDSVFLLDVKQINTVYRNDSLLGGDNYYIGSLTDEAVYNSAYMDPDQTIYTWLRTPDAVSHNAGGSYMVRAVSSGGIVDNPHAYYEFGGVRPAFFLDSVSFSTGSGTNENPYIIYARRVLGSGNCGDDLTWTLYEGGRLVISGTGKMTDWNSSSDVPWSDRAGDIISITLDPGVSSIGNYAFYGCENTKIITIPDGVIKIGDHAFTNATGIERLNIPKSLKIVGEYAYSGCSGLTDVYYGSTETYKRIMTIGSNNDAFNDATWHYADPEVCSIGIGEYLQMGEYYGQPILWRCVGFEKISGYDDNGNPVMDSTDTRTTYEEGYLPLMLADRILCLKPFDAKGTVKSGSHGRGYYHNSIQGDHRQKRGSNYWGDSNIRDWLNSSASAGNVVWSCGNPPTNGNVYNGYNEYNSEAGFLDGFLNNEIAAIKTVTQKAILDGYEYTDSSNSKDNNWHQYNNSISSVVVNYTTALSQQITDSVFLLDVKQINNLYKNDNLLGGGHYYIGVPTNEAVTNSEYKDTNLTEAKEWTSWLRTPDASSHSENSCYVRYTDASGSVKGGYAYNGRVGVRPAFFLDSVCFESGTGYYDDPYTIPEEPHTDTTVVRNGDTFTVSIDSFRLDSAKFIIAGYKNDHVVSTVILDADDIQPIEFTGDFDTFKVMAWEDISNLAPLCDAEIIPENKWVIE